MAHKIAYARVSTADQNPDLQLDALAAEGYLKIYTDVRDRDQVRPAAVERVSQRSTGPVTP